MPERDNPSSSQDADTRLGDLFENLPAPTTQIPTVDNTPPAPGSRRAAREAASAARGAAGGATPPTAGPSSTNSAAATADEGAAGQAPAGQAPAGQAPTAPSGEASPLSSSPRSGSGDTGVQRPVTESEAARPSKTTEPSSASADRTPAAPEHSGGGLADLFQQDHDDHDGPRAPKKKRRTGCLVALIIILVLIGGVAAGGAWVMNTYGDKINEIMGWGDPVDWEPGQATGEVLVTIHEGDTGEPVSAALYEAGVTRTKDVFYDHLVDENIAVTFYPGIYKLQEKMTAADALEALRNPENKLENTVAVSEGGTISSILPGISEILGFPVEELEAAVADPSVYGVNAQSLEGWLFPAVYTFDPGTTATQVIQRMVDRTRESLAAAGVPDADAQRVLTIASIIQREGRTDDFAKVSRVIQNRLDIDMKLQMDSTAQYGYGSLHAGVVSSSAEALNDQNPWNTYVNTGLPVTPIASPSDAAIDAAMHPADGPWLYFVTINLETGETVFTTTYEEHQAAIQKWDEWCRANPDGGCS